MEKVFVEKPKICVSYFALENIFQPQTTPWHHQDQSAWREANLNIRSDTFHRRESGSRFVLDVSIMYNLNQCDRELSLDTDYID